MSPAATESPSGGVAGEEPQGSRDAPGRENRLERAAPFGTLIALAGLIVLFGVLRPDDFLAAGNLRAILSQGALLAIVAGGLTVCLISWDFDLSIGVMATLGGITVALLLEQGIPLWPAVLLTALLGCVVGGINGIVVVRLRVSAFIGTLAMLSVLDGVAKWWSANSAVPILDPTFTSLATDEIATLQLPVVIAIVWYVVLWIVLERTESGRKLYAVGANAQAARLAGLPVKRIRSTAFVVCSAAAALAGVLLAAKLNGAYHGAGDAFLLDAYAAVFLGAVTLRIGQFHVLGTAVGILLLAVVTNGLDVLGVSDFVVSILKGTILIAAVSIAGASGALRRGS